MSRTQKALYNISASMAGSMLVIVLKFLNRIILIKTLGAAYLGITGLFNSVFSILDLAELGISAAITYAMYKPLAENDTEKIKSLMQLYKKAYIIIGVCISVLGILLFPFLPYIIKDKSDLVNLNLIYFMYLGQTVISYCCFSYKSAIISADQKGYKLTFINSLTQLLVVVLQGLVLLLAKSYLCYLTVSILGGIGKNYWAAKKAEKLYPIILEKNIQPLDPQEKRHIFDNIKGLALYKISSKILTSTDNIIISTYIGISMVGKFDNYNYFWMVFSGMCMILFNTYTPSIGNLYVTESREKLEEFFRNLNFANFWIYGVCSVGLYVLMSPTIQVFFGEEYVLSEAVVILIVLNLATAGLQNAVITYKDACGLFYKGRLRPLFSALLNIVISLLLVGRYGIAGVVTGTIISRFLTTWWFDAWMVHHYIFMKNPFRYYIRYLYHLFCICVCAAICKTLYLYIFDQTRWSDLFVAAFMVLGLSNLIFYIMSFWQQDFKAFCKMMSKIAKKIMRR